MGGAVNRRQLLQAMLAAPVVASPNRVYSFLWDNPLVTVAPSNWTDSAVALRTMNDFPGEAETVDLDYYLKAFYDPAAVEKLVPSPNLATWIDIVPPREVSQ